jgi:hypothetical protein
MTFNDRLIILPRPAPPLLTFDSTIGVRSNQHYGVSGLATPDSSIVEDAPEKQVSFTIPIRAAPTPWCDGYRWQDPTRQSSTAKISIVSAYHHWDT